MKEWLADELREDGYYYLVVLKAETMEAAKALCDENGWKFSGELMMRVDTLEEAERLCALGNEARLKVKH